MRASIGSAIKGLTTTPPLVQRWSGAAKRVTAGTPGGRQSSCGLCHTYTFLFAAFAVFFSLNDLSEDIRHERENPDVLP